MENEDSNEYFKTYGDLEVQKIMLEDTPRNQAYRQAILDNKAYIKGKIIIDVGAGTGILSIMCAQMGAARVIAIEASEIYKVADSLIKENGFESVITVIHDKVENVANLPCLVKADVLVSEWMGFYLLHEGMLNSVICARDKFLKEDGIMLPDSAILYAAPCSVTSMYDNWLDVEGVSMRAFSDCLRKQVLSKPQTITLNPHDIIASPEVVFWCDLKTVKEDDLYSIKLEHIFVATKEAKYQGVALWFTCTFPSHLTEPALLSTDPEDPSTHWKQTVIVLPEERTVEMKEPLALSLSLTQCRENLRRYDVELCILDPEEVDHPDYCTCYMTKCILKKAVLEKYESGDMDTNT